MTDVAPVHGYNGFIGIMRSPLLSDHELQGPPAWECLVEVRDIGVVSAWVDARQRRTPPGKVLWVSRYQVTFGGNGQPIVRGPCTAHTYVPGERLANVEQVN